MQTAVSQKLYKYIIIIWKLYQFINSVKQKKSDNAGCVDKELIAEYNVFADRAQPDKTAA